jgi:hypothetical protein
VGGEYRYVMLLYVPRGGGGGGVGRGRAAAHPTHDFSRRDRSVPSRARRCLCTGGAYYVVLYFIWRCSFLNCSKEKGCMGEVGWEGSTGT